MTQTDPDLDLDLDLDLEVTSVSRDGKRRYSRQAKRRLVEACLQPGISVAGLALKAGVNASLLRRWIKLHQHRHGDGALSRRDMPSVQGMRSFVLAITHNFVASSKPSWISTSLRKPRQITVLPGGRSLARAR
jgi:transposase-like protein